MTTHLSMRRRLGATLAAFTLPATALLMVGGSASAAVAPTVPLGTSANYSVLGAETVTNVGNSVLSKSLGLSPGTDITGFPPGKVLPTGTTDTTNAAAAKGQSDLTKAYLNAKGRSVNANTPADLANLQLQAGVYAGPSKGALKLNGPLVLDGAGDPNSVFIFQTDSSLITGAGSTVTLINGAQECNVFWQVGSSATLGTASVFTGNILALTSIWLTDSVTVHGRALATTGEVTLINDRFFSPTCSRRGATGTGGGSGPTTTPPGGGTPPTLTPGTPTGLTPNTPGGPGTPGAPGTPGRPGRPASPGVPPVTGPPKTGAAPIASECVPWPP
ncbi:MAG: hypothetical protein QOD92_3168 [Acidimicrobiaceae bacterium]|jgi:hypothetical protein